MSFSPLISQLIDSFRCLPGVGPKSAQRMVFHLLERDRDGAKLLANKILETIELVGNCSMCRTFSENEHCSICSNTKRDEMELCIVESPIDVVAIENSTDYNGLYFVLLGHLSPLDGIMPNDIGLDILNERITNSNINEIILATNSTVEGEATAHYISEMFTDNNLKITRIAHGVPVGGELEFVDGGTISHAFYGRREI
ncbi:Recombination protein RecR [hydrothermal vent metagenome]|uniref:Recombination protein RecR n=1 Tax=hydrothermal vent metagenome TaxID=652676 RepID=A0A3B1A016_9ZZZZ